MELTAILEKEQILLAGMSFFGDPFAMSSEWTEENEIGRLWARFMAYLSKHNNCIPSRKARDVCYEVHIQHEETKVKGHYEIFIGVEIDEVDAAPVELQVKVLPATAYAVFTLRGQAIVSDWWREIYQEWLPQSGYQCVQPYSFQYYDRRFKGMDKLDESTLDVYIPVMRLA